MPVQAVADGLTFPILSTRFTGVSFATMKKKKAGVSLSSNRRIELLSHYYKVDKENKIVYIELRYEKASELLEKGCGLSSSPMFSTSVLEKVGSIYSLVPVDFTAEIEFYINDYEGFDPKGLLERFNEALELNNYLIQKDKRKKWLQAVLLILAGISILAIMGVGTVNHWFGAEGTESAALWSEVLDIAGWVFIWEAVTVFFLEPNPLGVLGLKILSRTNGIRFYQGIDKTILAEENGKAIMAKWEDEGKIEKSGKTLLLVCSAALLATGVGTFMSSCLACLSGNKDTAQIISTIIAGAIVLVIDGGAGGTGIARFVGKKGKIASASIVFAVLISLQLIGYIALSFYYMDWKFTFPAVLTFLLQVGYVYGVVVDIIKNKKNS